MATAWGGADPTEAVDPDDYELGTEYRANADLTITHVRIWTGAGEENVTGRRARIWSTGGSQQALVTLPDDLAPGWSQHALDTPLEKTAGSRFVVSYSTGGNYGVLANALDANVDSADGLVTALSAANATNGNGVFNLTPGTFPATSPASHPFYGVDFVYGAGIGGNTSPRITQLTATPDGATVTAVVVAEDDEALTGATYRFNWGDGTADTVTTHPNATAQHTYSASGTYAVLVTVTDSEGAADYEAVAVTVHVPDPAARDLTEADVAAILSAVESHALSSGWFERVNGHEPKAISTHGLTAAVWIDNIQPVAARSGLNTSSYRLTLMVRIYANGDQEPLDAIDPAMVAATSALMKAYSGDFSLGGAVDEVDLLGEYGVPMSAQAGWLPVADNSRMRVMTITVPLIVNDVWEQVA